LVESLGYKPEGLRPDEVIEFFSIYLILPAALGPGDYSASNRNEYQKQKKKKSFYRVEHGRHIRLTTSPPPQCQILKISLPYRPLQPVMGIVLVYFKVYIFTYNKL
jgi:hypothetical protein